MVAAQRYKTAQHMQARMAAAEHRVHVISPQRHNGPGCGQQDAQFFADRAAALAAMRRALVPAGGLAIPSWTDLPSMTSFAALADALERHLGTDAGVQMRQPWSLSDRDELHGLAAEAGFEQIELSAHTATARFPRHDFARELVLATPLATEFERATAEQQAAILGDVTDAVSTCDGCDGQLRHPLTANFLTAMAPNRVVHARGNAVAATPARDTARRAREEPAVRSGPSLAG
jgi:hypothetical protein